MPNSVISQIVIGSNTYDIKDAYARQAIEDLGDALYWIGVTTTELTDGATTNPITVGGESIEAKVGGMAQYSGEEFVWNGTAWQSIGKNNFGDLAFVSEARGSYTPAGEVSITPATDSVYSITDVGTLPTVDPTTDSVYSITDVGTLPVVDPTTDTVYSITDVGTLPTVAPTTDTVYSITDVGTLPEMTVSGETLTFTPGTLPTKGAGQTVVADVGYTAGTLPTKGAAQTVVTDVGYTAGTLPTKGAAQTVMTGATATFNGTAATIVVTAPSD